MKIFIGSSSSDNIEKKYLDDCNKLVSNLFELKNDLVFGAYNKGLMGDCYRTALKYNRRVIGISPKNYKDNFNELECNEVIITNSVVERINKIIEVSDLLLFLPGGTGTLNELFLAIESKRANKNNKKIVIYNSYNYYDLLIAFLDNAYESKFVDESVKNLFFISNNIEDIINYLK